MQPDRYDRQILDLLQREGRISNQDLADRVNLSPSACLRRVRALEDSNLITGYRALLDARRLGFSLTALVYISHLDGSSHAGAFRPFRVRDFPDRRSARMSADYRAIR